MEMKRQEIEVNGKKVVILQQPTKTIIDWERKHGKDMIGYIKDILRYPSGVNPSLEDLVDSRTSITVDGIELKYENTEDFLRNVIDIFKEAWTNMLFCGDVFLRKAGKNVNDYTRREVEEIGKKGSDEIRFVFQLVLVVHTFQNL